jgi:hypothetical protein
MKTVTILFILLTGLAYADQSAVDKRESEIRTTGEAVKQIAVKEVKKVVGVDKKKLKSKIEKKLEEWEKKSDAMAKREWKKAEDSVK